MKNASRALFAPALRCLLAFSVSTGAIMAASPALAQDEEAVSEDTIVVTGSRIARSGFDAPQPLTVIDAEAIALSGTATNIGNFLNELPALGSTFTTANSTRFIGTGGGSFLDLRDLGTARTLVLVDGKRHISQAPGTSAVDVNTIPTDLIERVEVITGGASAIYGADAVTGVVNFIMKDNFEGLTIRGQAGTGMTGAFDDHFFSATGGVNFDDGRGNAVISVEYAERSQVEVNDVDNDLARRGRQIQCTEAAQARFGDEFAPPGFDECVVPGPAGLAFISEAGTFFGPGGLFSFRPDGEVFAQDISNLTEDLECFDCDFLDLQSFTTLQPRIERLNFSGRLRYDIAEAVSFYVDTRYVNTTTIQAGQPSFDNGAAALIITPDNAFASPSLLDFFADNNLDSIAVTRFNSDLGRRGEENERETYRVVAGFTGDFENPLFGNREWTYDLSYNFGRTSRTLVARNNRLNANWQMAADAVVGPDGRPECRVTQQLRDGEQPTLPNGQLADPSVAARCVPANVLGFGNITQDVKDFVLVDSLRTDENQQQVWNAYVSGDILDLPAGPVGFAFGGEYREEESETIPALEDRLGLTFGNQLQIQEGRFDVYEAFAEIRIPVLKDLPFAEFMEVSSAFRFGDYSTVGSNWTYKADAVYSPFEDLTLRGGYSRAIRAPNIGELFGPLDQNFFNVQDPCSESEIAELEGGGTAGGAERAALRRQNCGALGRPDGFESAIDDATLPGVTGGNPDLEEETAITFTIGAIMEPRWVPGLRMSLDYWNIDIENGIGVSPPQEILDLCVEAAGGIDNQFCNQVSRDPGTFEITNIQQVGLNFSAIEAEGVDYEVVYDFNLNDALALFGSDVARNLGDMTFRVVGTHYLEQVEFPFAADPDDPESFRGELGTPKNLFNFNMVHRLNRLTLNYDLRFLGNQLIVDDEDFEDAPNNVFPFETGNAFYHDISARYDLLDEVSIYGGIDNLTNNLPSDFLVSSTGTGAFSGVFNNIGRFFYIGAELRF